jgi:hypothetical protein
METPLLFPLGSAGEQGFFSHTLMLLFISGLVMGKAGLVTPCWPTPWVPVVPGLPASPDRVEAELAVLSAGSGLFNRPISGSVPPWARSTVIHLEHSDDLGRVGI